MLKRKIFSRQKHVVRKQCLENRIVDRPQNRSDSMQKTVFDQTGVEPVEPAIEPVNQRSNRWSNRPVLLNFFFFELKRRRFDAFLYRNDVVLLIIRKLVGLEGL